MCSIAGFICSQPLEPTMAARLSAALLFHGSGRGQQSAGVWANDTLYKKAMHPHKLIDTDEFFDVFEEPTSLALLHTRMPTSGGTGDEQAHPFWVGNTVTTHNGHITNIEAVKEKYGIDKPSGVDSELFASGIDKLGIDKITEFVSEVQGSAALAIYHEGTLFLARDSNPLEYFRLQTSQDDKPLSMVVFGSTEKQVMNALQHCWLIDGYSRTVTLPEYKVFSVRADGTTQDIAPFRLRAWSPGSSWHGTHHYGRSYSSHSEEWGADDDDRRVSSTIFPGPGYSGKPSISTYRDKDGVSVIKVGPLIMTPMEVALLMKDETIKAVEKQGTAAWRGWGWKVVSVPTTVIPGGPHSAWEYDFVYGLKQRIKFGDLSYVVTMAASLAKDDEKHAAKRQAADEKEAKKKEKKDRNRNKNKNGMQLSLVPDTKGSIPAK